MNIILDYAPWSFVVLGVIVLILFILFLQIRKTNKIKDEAKAVAEARARDVALNGAIENKSIDPNYINHRSGGYKPVETNYGSKNLNVSKINKILKIKVHQGVSLKEYDIDPNAGVIVIGRDKASSIYVADETVSLNHCEIFTKSGNAIYVRDVKPDNKTVLKHAGRNTVVGASGNQIKNGDRLMIGNTTIDITIL